MAYVFFLPKKTAARAVQPVPLEMFGTNDESLMLKIHPAALPNTAAAAHAQSLTCDTFIPLARRTGASLPEILMYKPCLVNFIAAHPNKNIR